MYKPDANRIEIGKDRLGYFVQSVGKIGNEARKYLGDSDRISRETFAALANVLYDVGRADYKLIDGLLYRFQQDKEYSLSTHLSSDEKKAVENLGSLILETVELSRSVHSVTKIAYEMDRTRHRTPGL